jgi:hypothetical protein
MSLLVEASRVFMVGPDGTRKEVDLNKMKPEQRLHVEKMIKMINEYKKQQAEFLKQAETARQEKDAARQEKDAARQEKDAARQEKDAARQRVLDSRALQRIADNMMTYTQQAKEKGQEVVSVYELLEKLIKQGGDKLETGRVLGMVGKEMMSDGDKLMMVSVLTQLVSPQFLSGNPQTRHAEISKAKEFVEREFSEAIAASYAAGDWSRVEGKNVPHINDKIVDKLMLLVVSTLKNSDLTLDLGRVNDELEIAATEKLILNPRIKRITFGDLSDAQLRDLAKYSKVRESSFFGFSKEAWATKFAETVKTQILVAKSAPAKSLPTPPPKPSRAGTPPTLIKTATPQREIISVAGSKEGSPPKA